MTASTLTLRQTKGARLTTVEGDNNWLYCIDSANNTFAQSGSASLSTVAGALSSLCVNVKVPPYSAAGDGATDDRAAIQSAITAAAATGKVVFFPAGTYRVTKGAAQTSEEGTTFPVFTMASSMHILAEQGATIKLADSQSTDASPVRIDMFFSNSVLTNVSIRGLTMDMNGANNKISPSRGTLTYNRWNMAHVSFSGTPAGIAARGTDVVLEDCSFINTPGVCSIVVAQSNTNGVDLGKRWTIRNCLFNNNGLDSDDHTSIFAWADDVLTDGCTFTADSVWNNTTKIGPVCAYEIHGSNHRFVNNKVNNYYQGFWIAANQTLASENGLIANNVFNVVTTGGDCGRENANMQAVRNHRVCNNVIVLSSDATPLSLRTGFSMENTYAITDITFDGNFIYSNDTVVASAGLYINPSTTAAQKNKRILFKNNTTTSLTMGVFLKSNATNPLGYVEIGGNTFINHIPGTGFADASGITYVSAAGSLEHLVIQPNSFIDDTGGVAFDYGILLTTGTISKLYVAPQYYSGPVTNYTESSLTVTTRKGYYSGTWTPALNSFTSVGAAPVVTGVYTRKGSLVEYTITIDPDTSVACTAGTSWIDLPFTVASHNQAVCVAANTSTFVGATTTGFMPVTAAQCYPPAWTATANTMVVSGSFITSDI